MAGPKQLQNLDVSNRRINSTNVPLEVAVLDGSGAQVTAFGSGGTQYTEGDIDATITGTALLFEVDSTANTVGVVSSTRPLPVTITGSAGSTKVSVQGILTLDGSTSLVDSTLNAVRITSADVGGSTQVAVSSVAGVVAVAPASSGATGFFAVRLSDGSTFVTDSTQRAIRVTSVDVGGATVVTVSTGSVRVHQSTAADLNVTVAGYSTVVSVSTGSVRVHQSTAGDLNVTVAGYSTTANVSSLAGVVTVAPISSSGVSMSTDTAPASTKQGLIVRQVGNTYDSSGALQVNTGPGGSTQVAISSGIVQVQPISSSGVSMSTDTDPASTKQGLIVRQVGFVAFSTVQTISTGSVRVHQSTAADLNVTVAGYSTVMSVSTGSLRVHQSSAADLNVTVAGYSTTMNVSSLAGVVTAEMISSSGVSMSTDTAPASTKQGLIVRQVGYSTTHNVSSLAGKVLVDQNSTVWPVQIPSSQTFQVKNSTIGDLLASVQQNSTVWAVQVDGRVRAQNSTIGDLLASVQQNSTVWQTQAKIQDSSGVGPNIVGTRPSTGAQGFAVRTVLNDLLSTCFSTLGNGSTSSTIVSSVAAQRVKVFAYSITSTAQAVNTLSFASSLANPIWTMQMQSVSSGITGANLAVSPPAWLFATEAASPLVFKVTGTTGTYHLSLSYFMEA